MVLEEMAKLPDLKTALSASSLKESRYIVYTLEKTLTEELSGHKDKGNQDRGKKRERKKKKHQ